MKGNYFFASLTRISNLPEVDFTLKKLPKEQWSTGDYVVGQVYKKPSRKCRVELNSGRRAKVAEGDFVVGALGNRYATLGVTGGWRDIGENGHMQSITAAGLFGKARSKSRDYSPLLPLAYQGHVIVAGQPARMSDFVPSYPDKPFTLPTIQLVGSSMSAGKTTVAKIIIRLLKAEGLRVIGSKLTGAGRYRDILGMADAGADHIFDFVDAGLPSTVCAEDKFRAALRKMLARMATIEADIMVSEVGASPLEPYNGEVAVAELKENIRFMVLCASDPYSVLGVREAFSNKPDLVAGLATSTEAGVALIKQLSEFNALNLMDKASLPQMRALLKESLGF